MNKIAHFLKIHPFYSLVVLLQLGMLSMLQAQQLSGVPQLMNYQAIINNDDGTPMVDQAIVVRFSLSSKDGESHIYYQELHETKTSFDGSINLPLGAGRVLTGTINEVPWSNQNIYLGVELAPSEPNASLKLVSRSQMMTVPYALVARKAGQALDTSHLDLRNQSRYWLTAGNQDTRPTTHFIGTRDNQDLHIKSFNNTLLKITKEGQLIYTPDTNQKKGLDNNKAVYPLYIESNEQGVFIEVVGDRSSANNFMTFEDNVQVWGRIEGQTLQELRDDPLYKLQVALYALKGVSLGVQLAGEIASASGEFSTLTGAGIAVGTIANSIIIGTEIVVLIADAASWADNLANSIGVAYQTGKGDYAEYLLRDTSERDLFPGEIVGIRNGQVSLKTNGADHFRVVSTAPAVIGNMPQEKDEIYFEKIAFMGQVPVRVTGAVKVGDYILPTGNHDGLAVAVDPALMKVEDYRRIVGVAWEEAPFALVNIVNVAVGINSNDLAPEVASLTYKINRIYDFLEGKSSLDSIGSVDLKSIQTTEAGITALKKLMTDEEFDSILEENAAVVKKVFDHAFTYLEAKDPAMASLPQFQALKKDPITFVKELRRNPDFFTQWAMIDQQFQALNKDK